MTDIILYSNGCPNCRTIKSYMDDHGIEYDVCDDVEKMIEMGFDSVPMVDINGTLYNFNDALKELHTMCND